MERDSKLPPDHSTGNKMRIADRIFQRSGDTAPNLLAVKQGLPLSAALRGDFLCDCAMRRRRVYPVIAQFGRETNEITKGIPEFLLERRRCDKSVVLRAIDIEPR